MKRNLTLIILIISIFTNISAQVSFVNLDKQVYNYTPESSTGLNAIYVIYDTRGVSMTYTASTDNSVTWYSFDSRGGGYATEISGVTYSGRLSTLPVIINNSGYIIEEGTNRTYVWVVNYADFFFHLTDVNISDDSDCDRVKLLVSGSGDIIPYYSINGQKKELSREIAVNYNTLVWDNENLEYSYELKNETISDISDHAYVTSPLCNTTFTVSGDIFLKYWGLEESVVSPTYYTKSTEVHTVASQAYREATNEKDREPTDNFGGSAPAEMEFKAYCSDALVYKEWQFSSYEDFDNISQKFNDESITYSFKETGTTYVRFYGTNSDGTCEAYGDTYTITIGESKLECPNTFSPDATPGINDEWKVSYKSLVSFKCAIFNRLGVKMYSFSNPELGWDGKYNGKYVNPGVYYYVIEAKGADGVEYKMNGDINIVKAK